MVRDESIVRAAREIFGARLRGLFLFGSRVAGGARESSDLDVAVWLEGPLRRCDTWLPWLARFGAWEPTVDPTFVTRASLDDPPGWLLEAVRGGTRVLFDPAGELTRRLAEIASQLAAGSWRRRLFMGLPYFERAAR